MQKNISGYANTRQHLDDSIMIPTGASHKHLHINPNEKKTGKGVATSLLRVDPQHDCSELVPRASRARTSRQRAPLDQRALLDHVHRSTTCTSRPTCASQHVCSAPFSRLHSLLSTSAFQNVRPHARLSRTLTCASCARAPHQHVLSQGSLSPLRPSAFHSPPSSGHAPTVSANRERTRHPSPLPFLTSEAGR